ncbi:MAG: 16S rRNA (cytosine(1402)-N(4))-methyltransferase RsmH [Nitrospirae bacterium]|nr:16S rRNA (cytosine(1402)-N(4))-methyltransferase RsmH [Nitrospirota bacterium]
MLRQVIDFLNIYEGGVYVDATVGGGGHSSEILKHIGTHGRVIATDRDEEALKVASQRLMDKRCSLRKARFSELEDVLGDILADGILFDFGLSMLQIKGSGRGFSFLKDEPLDMRMDRAQSLKAEDIVNSYPERDIERILREYGEERFSSRIARRILLKRPIRSTMELSKIIEEVFHGRGRIHPATRTFQALRIAVNNELNEIQDGLHASLKILKRQGRLVAISYHSLEDRLVKNFMRTAKEQGTLSVLTKKPVTPDETEQRANPSARSAKLRAGERV